MILYLKEYKKRQEQKKIVIWEFLFNYFNYDYMATSKIYSEITVNAKSINEHYNMILEKNKKAW